jgi:hypothetical protein
MDDEPAELDQTRPIISLALVIGIIAFAATTLWWMGA